MAYDEDLADELRSMLDGRGEVTERKMFGGLAFLVDGHMTVGVIASSGMFRLGPAGVATALGHPNVRPMDFTGRVSRGMVYADRPGPGGLGLKELTEQALAFVGTLPPK